MWLPDKAYDCPEGFHWATSDEGDALFTTHADGSVERFWHSIGGAEEGLRRGRQGYDYLGTTERATSIGSALTYERKVYYDECGWENFQWLNKTRVHFRFSDSKATGRYKHAGKPDSYRPDVDSLPLTGSLLTEDFAGIVCVAGPPPECLGAACSRASSAGRELWRSDGTVLGTERVEDVYAGSSGSNPAYMAPFKGMLYYAATTSVDGRELWRSSDEPGSAEMLTHPGDARGIFYGINDANPAEMTAADDFLFFAATDHLHGRELYMVHYVSGSVGEGTLVTELLYVDIAAGKTASSDPEGFETSGGTLPVYFSACTKAYGRELWRSDGTSANTHIVADIHPGKGDSNPRYITWFKGGLYFQADDGSSGVELWFSDGTAANTKLLVDIRQGSFDGFPSYFTSIRSSLDPTQSFLAFTANDGYATIGASSIEGYGGSQLWRTDGTAEGTQRIFRQKSNRNDLYIDRPALDAAFPARMAFFMEGLYVPASAGTRNLVVPKGGSRSLNEAALHGTAQVAAITDVDTPDDANVTVMLASSQGFVVLTDKTEQGASSPKQLNILLAEAQLAPRTLLFDALTKLGHAVTTVTDGRGAYEAFSQRVELLATYAGHFNGGADLNSADFRQFDCIVMSLQFKTDGGQYDANYTLTETAFATTIDGFQATRLVRRKEAEAIESPSGALVGVPASRVPIIATALPRQVLNDRIEALAAGADFFLPLSYTNYLRKEDMRARVVLPGQTSTEASLYMKQQEMANYASLASLIQRLVARESSSVNITASGGEGLDALQLDRLPGVTVGRVVEVTGSIAEVNSAMQNVYFYASPGTVGDVELSITAIDQPLPCTLQPAALQLQSSTKTFYEIPDNRLRPRRFANMYDPVLATSPGTETPPSRLCDSGVSNRATATIPFLVQRLNSPPVIVIADDADKFDSLLNAQTSLPQVIVSDHDFDGLAIKTSFGDQQQPPMVVTLSCNKGRISLTRPDGVAYVSGKAELSRSVSLQGPIDKVNIVLASALYSCGKTDGCVAGDIDVVTIAADDLGTSGKGGSLTTTRTVTVNIF